MRRSTLISRSLHGGLSSNGLILVSLLKPIRLAQPLEALPDPNPHLWPFFAVVGSVQRYVGTGRNSVPSELARLPWYACFAILSRSMLGIFFASWMMTVVTPPLWAQEEPTAEIEPTATDDEPSSAAAAKAASATQQELPERQGSMAAQPRSEFGAIPAKPWSPAGKIRAVPPDFFYMLDKNGIPVPLPIGLRIEDFQHVFQIEQGLATPVPAPQFVIEKLQINGRVRNEQAELSLRFVFRVLRDTPVRIPLGMANVIPRNIPSSNDERRITVRYEEESGGYVAWVQAKAESQQELTLNAIVPIQKSANQSSLTLETPRATVSEMSLTVPEQRPNVFVSDDARIVQRTPLADETLPNLKGTKLELVGVAGVLRLTWSEPPAGAGKAASSLEVDSTLLVRFGGPDVMRTDATFRVQSFGQPIDSVRVQFPKKSQVISTGNSPYQITVEDQADNLDYRVAVFQLAEPTPDPFTVRMRVEQRQDDASAAPLSAGGFFVEGAFRHTGHLALAVEGDWLPRWDDTATLRPTASIPPDLQSETESTVFRYYKQPFALPLTIVRKQTRTSVIPTFVFDVQSDRVEMRALLQVTVHGAPTPSLTIDTTGWEVYDIADTVPLNNDELVLQESPLRIPFSRPQRGRFEIEVFARRKVQPDDTKLRLRLPNVLDASAAQATIIAQPADNVELNIEPDESLRLMLARVPTDLTLPTSEQLPLCHRIVDVDENASCVYRFRLKPRSVQASVNTQVVILPATLEVEQQMTLDVRNAPLDRIVLRVPERLRVDSLRVAVDGSPLIAKSDPELETILAAKFEESGNVSDFSYPVYELPFGSIGTLTANVRFALNSPLISSPKSTEWDIPLPLPEVEQIGTHEVAVRGQAKTSLRTGDSRWTTVNEVRRREKASNLLTVTAKGNVSALAVQVSALSDDDFSSTNIFQAFVQTWATHNNRRDRAVFRFNSTEDSLQLKVPVGIRKTDTFTATLDEIPIQSTWINDAIVEFDLSEVRVGEHILEVTYGFEEPLKSFQNLIHLPTVEGANWTHEFFWQLIVPSRHHLIQEPAGFLSANRWGWNGLSWGRTPEHDQFWLETTVGATHQTLPPGSTNQYLFTTFGEVKQLKISIANRTTIASVLSGGAFLVVFLFLSFAWMRRPFVILLTLFLTILGGFLAPVSILALLPPIALGLALALLIPILKRVIGDWNQRRHRAQPALRRSPSTSIRLAPGGNLQADSAQRNATTATLEVPQDA